jgi:tRNA threonylcarbamoyladenosine biosynthesis protein TsaE
MTQRFVSHDEEETQRLGGEIAALLPRSGAIYLHGDLGAGKTALIRAIVTGLGADPDEVSSPTFAIENDYLLPDGSTIVHLDCYRLSDRQREWEEIGIPELLQRDGLTLVEWPKPEFKRFVEEAGTISIEVGEDDERVIIIDTK